MRPRDRRRAASTSIDLSMRRFQRRPPTLTAAVTRDARSGSLASIFNNWAAWLAASSPTTSGSLAKRSRRVTGITAPVRSISSILPSCCHSASGSRSTRRTYSVSGRRRSISAERTQGRRSSCSLARTGSIARIGVPSLAPSASKMVSRSVVRRPSTRMSATRKPSAAVASSKRCEALCSRDRPNGAPAEYRSPENRDGQKRRNAGPPGEPPMPLPPPGAAAHRGARRPTPRMRRSPRSRPPVRQSRCRHAGRYRAPARSGSCRAGC